MNPTGFADNLAPGELPAGWVWASLAEITRINPPLDNRNLDDAQRVTFVPMAAVDEGFGGVQRPSFRPFSDVKKGYTPFQVSDIIMAKITPCMENGKGGVVKGADGEVFFGSTEFHVFRPYPGILPQWIGAFLAQERVRRAARLGMKGSAGQLRVPEEFLNRLHLPLAPLVEQIRITERIDELFTDLSAGVTSLERVRKKLKRYRRAVLHAAVTGRLTTEWRKTQGPSPESGEKLLARILIERRRQWEKRTLDRYAKAKRTPPKDWQGRYVEPAGPNISALPELPQEWCWASADQLGWVQLGRQRSPKNRSNKFPTKYLRAANLTERGLDLSDVLDMEFEPNELQTYRLMAGDVLLSEASGSASQVGKPVVWRDELKDCAFQNTVVRLRPALVDSDYLYTYFLHCYRNQIFANVARGVGINHLSADKFSKIAIALPPMNEQTHIVDAVNEKLSQIDAMEAEVARGLARGARLRQAILNSAFAGKIVPQHRGDEPASTLLERIRAERIAAAETRPAHPKRSRKMVS
jgi:type I restriction enzyme, S subunit